MYCVTDGLLYIQFLSLQKTVRFDCHIHIKVESHHIKVRNDSSSRSGCVSAEGPQDTELLHHIMSVKTY